MTVKKELVEALRANEEMLRIVTDNLPGIVAYVDSGERYRFVNRLFEKWRECSSAEIIGRPVSEVVGKKVYEQIKPHIEAALSGKTVSFEDTFTYPDGTKRVLHAQYIPHVDECGSVRGLCALITDITRLKSAEEEITKYKEHIEVLVEMRTEEIEKVNDRLLEEVSGHEIAQEKIRSLNRELNGHVKKLEEVNRELEAFSYSLAHDLSSPLRVIDGFSKMLEKYYGDRLEGEGRDFINTIRAHAQKMERFISDLLKLSRLGRSEIRKSDIDMVGLARSLCDELSAMSPDRNIKFIIKDLPAAHGERTLIRQALFNLLANAVKFTRPRKNAAIEVGGTIAATDAGVESVYYVKDNGVGFNMRHASRLFGIFKRLHTEDEFEGTGAGLAIVWRIIERHGGRAWADGTVGKGATFWFALPGNGD